MENNKKQKKDSNDDLLEMQVEYVVNCLKEAEVFATKNNVKRAKVVK